MNRSKFWPVIVVVLLLVNTGMLAMWWMKKADMPHEGTAKDFLINELKLTATQQEEYNVLREAHQKQIRDIMHGMRELKDELADKISSPATDTTALDQLTMQIGEKERQRDLATYYHFRSFRMILTKEQQERFDEVIRDVLHMMAGPKKPRPGDRATQKPG
jgi:Spy/CpxP family protein refolding chaperone